MEVFGAFKGSHGEPRKRPGPDVIGHQLTVLRARAPPAEAAVPPWLRHMQPGSGLRRFRRTRRPEPLLCPARPQTPRAHRVAPGPAPSSARGFVRNCSPELGGRETGLERAAGNAFPTPSVLDPYCKRGETWPSEGPRILMPRALHPSGLV